MGCRRMLVAQDRAAIMAGLEVDSSQSRVLRLFRVGCGCVHLGLRW